MTRKLMLGAGLMMLSGVLFATPIGICGTGFSSGCGAQINPTSGAADGNFSLVANADGASTTAFVVLNNQMPVAPFGTWLADTGTGEWIGPAAGGNEMTNDVAGNYNYQESFDLTGFTLSSVTLSGFWAVDNHGCIFLNGTNTGDCITSDTAYSALTAFSIVNGQNGATFNSGINTITFETVNITGPTLDPTGLLVELSGTGTLAGPAPEPMTLSMLGVGLLGLGLVGRKLRK